MGLRQQFGTNLVWSAAGNWSREIINFGVFLALARLLGPESYGVMGMTSIATAFASAFLVDGLSTFIVRQKQLDAEHLNAVFWSQTVIALIIALLMTAVGPPLARFYAEPQISAIMPVLAALPLLYSLSSVPTALLQRAMRFRPLTVRSLVAASVGGSVGIGLASAGYGVWSLVLMMIAQWVAQCCCLWWATDWRPGFQVHRRHLDDVARFGVNAVGVKLLTLVDQQLPRLVIAISLGAVSLGFFTMAWRILEVIYLLTMLPIGQVLLPTFASFQADTPRLRAGLGAVTEFSAAIVLPCCVGLFAIAPVLVPVLFGSRWLGAIPLLQLFSILGVTWGLASSFDAAIIATGRMTWRTRLTLLGVVMLGAGLVVTHRFGLAAIGATMVVRGIVFCGVYATALHRQGLLDGPAMLRRVLPFAVAAAIMAGLVMAWGNAMALDLGGPALLASGVLVGALSYGTSVALLARRPAITFIEAALAIGARRQTPS